jgi:hypothetical protein
MQFSWLTQPRPVLHVGLKLEFFQKVLMQATGCGRPRLSLWILSFPPLGWAANQEAIGEHTQFGMVGSPLAGQPCSSARALVGREFDESSSPWRGISLEQTALEHTTQHRLPRSDKREVPLPTSGHRQGAGQQRIGAVSFYRVACRLSAVPEARYAAAAVRRERFSSGRGSLEEAHPKLPPT